MRRTSPAYRCIFALQFDPKRLIAPAEMSTFLFFFPSTQICWGAVCSQLFSLRDKQQGDAVWVSLLYWAAEIGTQHKTPTGSRNISPWRKHDDGGDDDDGAWMVSMTNGQIDGWTQVLEWQPEGILQK